MANKQLTANVRLNTKQAEQKLRNIAKAIDALNRSVGRQSNAHRQVNAALGNTQKITARVKKKTDENTNSTNRWATAVNKVATNLKGTSGTLGSIGSKLQSIAATYLGVMGARTVMDTSDTITKAQNKLNYINGNDPVATQETMDKMYASAQKVRMGYDDMMSNVSKSMALAGDAFGGNIDNAIRFQEVMAEAYAVGGASQQEMSTSMYQMIQALGAGTLAGDELRSVREGAPLAYQAIEKFAQGIYKTDESLKDLASQGKITGDMVVAAMLDANGAAKTMDEAFAQTAQTFEQTWTQVKNAAIKAFEPVSGQLQKLLQDALDSGLIDKVAGVLQKIISAVGTAITWIADNWNWLKWVIVAGLLTVCGIMLYQATVAVMVGIANLLALTPLAWIIIIIIAAVMALVLVFLLWKTGTIDACTAIVTALLIVAVAIFIIGLITGSTAMLIIGIILAVVAIIFLCLEYIAGAICVAVAFVWNIIVGVINAIIQFLWTYFVEPWIGIIEWVLNVFNGGFNSFGDAVKNLLGNIISWFLSLGKVVTKIIDAIFGTDWTGGLNKLQDKVLSWGKNEQSITLSREAPTIQSLTGGAVDRWSYGDAWNTGFDWGSGVKDAINGWASQGQSEGSLLDTMGNALGGTTNTTLDEYIAPSADDLLKGVNGTEDNTGKMADSMDLAEEDLAYLRRIADMEWKKEYTTAQITVDMSNYNTINGESDLDGIVTKLSEKLQEELNVVANGVYA